MSLYSADVPMSARFTAASRHLAGHAAPIILGYFPVARMNPFQSLLYSRATAHGVMPVATTRLEDLTGLQGASALGAEAVAHLHWTGSVLAECVTQGEANDHAEQFLQFVRELQEGGVRVVWTVHNRLPHHAPFPEVEAAMRQGLASTADVIHVMTSDTVASVADLYRLSEDRVVLAEHPSYVSAYPTHHDRRLVRFETGFGRDDFVVGMLGSIQPYKGIEDLATALDQVAASDPHVRGLVAGIPGRDAASEALVKLLVEEPFLKVVPARLSDVDIARLTIACDVVALPYRSTLNSGAALMALSLGVPIVAPRLGQFSELASLGFCLAYNPADPDGLRSALMSASTWVETVDRDAMRAFVEERSGPVISDRFFSALRDHLGVGNHRAVHN